jgi:hypothetical protein
VDFCVGESIKPRLNLLLRVTEMLEPLLYQLLLKTPLYRRYVLLS